MNSKEMSVNKPLDKVYQEASQWVRLVNTIIWTMGALLVPVSFGLVGLALNKSSGTQFEWRGKVILGIGSVFLFSFWVYASFLYRKSNDVARTVLKNIEEEWGLDKKRVMDECGQIIKSTPTTKNVMSLYKSQDLILNRWHGLFPLQMVTLIALVSVWAFILYLKL